MLCLVSEITTKKKTARQPKTSPSYQIVQLRYAGIEVCLTVVQRVTRVISIAITLYLPFQEQIKPDCVVRLPITY